MNISGGNVQDSFHFWAGNPKCPEFHEILSDVVKGPQEDVCSCISRLYVPLCSSKQILKQKLLLAIKTKNFGFV
uniref:HECT domain-containing protein n=1 Tax=Xiphophorus maculatus TaxID=8083 RepID=A0A3B5R4X5_XIPMA